MYALWNSSMGVFSVSKASDLKPMSICHDAVHRTTKLIFLALCLVGSCCLSLPSELNSTSTQGKVSPPLESKTRLCNEHVVAFRSFHMAPIRDYVFRCFLLEYLRTCSMSRPSLFSQWNLIKRHNMRVHVPCFLAAPETQLNTIEGREWLSIKCH